MQELYEILYLITDTRDFFFFFFLTESEEVTSRVGISIVNVVWMWSASLALSWCLDGMYRFLRYNTLMGGKNDIIARFLFLMC